MPSTSICRLIDRCAQGAYERGWEEFVDRYGQHLASRVSRFLCRAGAGCRREEVEELVQEIYCRLLDRQARRLRRFRGVTEPEVIAFLGRVAANTVYDHLRSRRALKRGRPEGAGLDPSEGTSRRPPVFDPAEDPEERLLARERRAIFLHRCRAAAGPRDPARDVLIVHLALIAGWSSREICRALPGELAPGTVDSVVYRMRRRLAAEGLEVPRRQAGGRGDL